MNPEFQFLVNYRLLAKEGGSLLWIAPVDYFEYDDFVEVVRSSPEHSLTIVTYYELRAEFLEELAGCVRRLSWIKLDLTAKEFHFKASLIGETHFAPSSFDAGVQPLDEGMFEYLDWLEEQALSEGTEIWNWSQAA